MGRTPKHAGIVPRPDGSEATPDREIAAVMAGLIERGTTEELHRALLSLLNFATREIVEEADRQLADRDLNRTHFRALFYIDRMPGLTLKDLVRILQISHQAVSKVIADLMRSGYLRQVAGTADRRRRLLHLTPKGRRLEQRIIAPQAEVLTRARTACGPDAELTFCRFLASMLNAQDRLLLGAMFLPETRREDPEVDAG